MKLSLLIAVSAVAAAGASHTRGGSHHLARVRTNERQLMGDKLKKTDPPRETDAPETSPPVAPSITTPPTPEPTPLPTLKPTKPPKEMGMGMMEVLTFAPITPAPVTPAPVSPAPITPAPVTPAPVTPAPVTPAPVTPAPVTPAPVTPAPVTSAPVTAAPVSPVTAAPVTEAPVTPALTEAPVTPAPVTPAPVTPAPVTPAPVTPAPVTPAPVTPAPVTPAPVTAAPVTSSPSASPFTVPVFVSAPIPPSPGFPPCNVCGVEGERVTKPGVILTGIPDQDPIACGSFQIAGDGGFVQPEFCSLVSTFVGPCECMLIPPSAAPITPAPVTPAPVGAPVPPSPGFPPCEVCGAGQRVTLTSVVIDVPTQGEVTCEDFERAGLAGFVDPVFCPSLPPFAIPCGCAFPTPAPVAPVAPTTPAPVTPAPVTPAPVTPAPITPAPVTSAPVTPAPVAPVGPPVPPSPGYPECNICGGDLRITLPDVIVDLPTSGPTRCDRFQAAGDNGFIEEQFCPLLSVLATPCGCA